MGNPRQDANQEGGKAAAAAAAAAKPATIPCIKMREISSDNLPSRPGPIVCLKNEVGAGRAEYFIGCIPPGNESSFWDAIQTRFPNHIRLGCYRSKNVMGCLYELGNFMKVDLAMEPLVGRPGWFLTPSQDVDIFPKIRRKVVGITLIQQPIRPIPAAEW